jgi:hypothetical protein
MAIDTMDLNVLGFSEAIDMMLRPSGALAGIFGGKYK